MFILEPVESNFSVSRLAVIDIQKQTAKVYQYNPEDPYSLPNNTVRCIFISKTNAICIGTDKGLALFNLERRHDFHTSELGTQAG